MEISTLIVPMMILLVIGAVLGILLGLADKFLKVELDPRLEKLITLLPGYNCGACGHPGCNGLAEAIFEQKGKLIDCKPMKPEQRDVAKDYLSTTPGPDGLTMDASKL